jgi:hypothetical protein
MSSAKQEKKPDCLKGVYEYYGWCGVDRLHWALVLFLWIAWLFVRALFLYIGWNAVLANYTGVQPIPYWAALVLLILLLVIFMP